MDSLFEETAQLPPAQIKLRNFDLTRFDDTRHVQKIYVHEPRDRVVRQTSSLEQQTVMRLPGGLSQSASEHLCHFAARRA
jgi:hypothetical protein